MPASGLRSATRCTGNTSSTKHQEIVKGGRDSPAQQRRLVVLAHLADQASGEFELILMVTVMVMRARLGEKSDRVPVSSEIEASLGRALANVGVYAQRCFGRRYFG
jgi:hypothetical protein